MERLITKSFKRLLDKGIHRGFVTHEELGKNKEIEKSDDPIRMYLREMGGVKLLSREGEIAIAKRIEAGKDYMIKGLFQSPLTAKKVFEWKEKLENGELLVREIIDIDSSYIETENEDQNLNYKKNKQNVKNKTNDKSEKLKKSFTEGETDSTLKVEKSVEITEQDEFNPSLAAMEEEVKPQIISIINTLCKDYTKLIKSQNDKLNCALNAKEFSRAKEKNYQKTQNNIIKKIKTLQLNSSVLENLLEIHYQENKKITSLEGILMRLVMENKISREEFLKYYLGNEINPNLESFLNENNNWKIFFRKKNKEFLEIKERLIEISKKIGLPVGEFKKLVGKVQKGEKESRIAKKEMVEAN